MYKQESIIHFTSRKYFAITQWFFCFILRLQIHTATDKSAQHLKTKHNLIAFLKEFLILKCAL